MSVLATPRSRPVSPEPPPEVPAAAPAAEVPASRPFSRSEIHRWTAVLIAPFVIGAAFFALAVGLGEEWPIAPAFLLGPLVMIAGYIYLSLTSESNTESP